MVVTEINPLSAALSEGKLRLNWGRLQGLVWI